MSDTFKVGDVVMLVSGGPLMTVESIRPDGVISCAWHDPAAPLLVSADVFWTQERIKEWEHAWSKPGTVLPVGPGPLPRQGLNRDAFFPEMLIVLPIEDAATARAQWQHPIMVTNG